MLTPFRAAALQALRAEQTRRSVEADSQRVLFDPLAFSFEAQRRFLADTSRYRVACTGRRAGKTTGVALDMLHESWSYPGGTVVYLNTTRDRAKRTIWEELKWRAQAARLPYRPNEAELSMRGPGNRWIHVSGGETKKQIEKWKGTLPAVVAFYADEVQDWDDELINHGIDRVMMPALADIGGRLTITGTPGLIPEGAFYALTTTPGWSTHHWTMFENPNMQGARQLLSDACRLRGVDENDPTIQREFFGRWVRDTQSMVFGALDDVLNSYALDDMGGYAFEGGRVPLSAAWSYVGGVDLGFVDSAAWEVLGWARKEAARLFVVHDEAEAEMGALAALAKCETVFGKYGANLMGVAMDPAAGGKNIASDVWTKYGIDVESAEKADKVGAIRLMSDAIRRRELLLPAHAKQLFRDLRRVQWDPDARGEKLKGHTPDRVDALLYGFRKAWPLFSFAAAKPEPTEEELFRKRVRDRILEKQANGDYG